MKIYHGTSLKRWESIQKDGLIPRGAHGKSNWTHSIESNPDTIYFSDAYAMNFALASLNTDALKKDHAVIIEVDSASLDAMDLVADEDVLEQVSRQLGRGKDGLPAHWGMIERTRYYRRKTRDYADDGLGFDWSMENMGTGGHIGAVPPKHFTRVAVIDIRAAAAICWEYMNSQITIMNYKFCGARYRALNALIFNDPYKFGPEDVMGQVPMPERPKKGIHILELKTKVAA